MFTTLFSTLLSGPEQGLSATQRAQLGSASEATWSAALEALAPHKVAPLLAHRLKEQQLLAHLPAQARAKLEGALRDTQQLNMLLFLTTAAILRSAAEHEAPVVLKGVLLADSYYPDPATRPMSDIDLVAAPGQFEGLCARLVALGFARSEDVIDASHTRTYVDGRGVLCDAHERLPELDGVSFATISEPCTLRRLRGVHALRLTPDAMLAHLVMHMHGHLPSLGPVLLWLLDIAFVLRVHGREISPERVRALCKSPAIYCYLLRVLGLLARHGERLPLLFQNELRAVLPLTLGSVLRQRRVTPWGLPTPRGFARIALSRLSLKKYERFQQPHAADLLLWPVDALCTRVSPLLLKAR